MWSADVLVGAPVAAASRRNPERRQGAALHNLENAYRLWRQHLEERSSGARGIWRQTRKQARQLVRQSRREWKRALRMLAELPEAA